MISQNRAVTLAFVCALLGGILVPSVYGYIDPGTGSYLLQILLAAILGGLFAIKVYWRKIKAFVLSKFGKSRDDEE